MSLARRVSAGRPPSPELEKAYEVLADGQWHSYDEVIKAVSLAVPPGRAIRHREDVNRWQRERSDRVRGGEPAKKRPVRPQRDIDHIIAVGKREIARRCVRAAKKIIHKHDDTGHWLRLRRPDESEPQGS